MFASNVTDKVTIGDNVVTIQKLSWKSLRHARDVRDERVMLIAIKAQAARDSVPRVGLSKAEPEPEPEPDSVDEPEDAAPPPEPPQAPLEERRDARYALYDQATVLAAGVKSWTDKTHRLPAALDDIDDEPAMQLHRAILDLSLPPLEEGAVEEARKNG